MGNETHKSIQTLRDRLVMDTDKLFNAQLLLWLGIVRNDIDDVEMALDNGADPNARCTRDIMEALNEYGYSY